MSNYYLEKVQQFCRLNNLELFQDEIYFDFPEHEKKIVHKTITPVRRTGEPIPELTEVEAVVYLCYRLKFTLPRRSYTKIEVPVWFYARKL